MSDVSLRERFRDEGLLPFQVEFLERFLSGDSPRYWQLIAPVGTGKTHLTLTLIRELFKVDPKARVLVLVPSALARQWRERAQSGPQVAANVEVLDRAALVELTSEAGQRPWPAGSLFITTHDLAAVRPVRDALASIKWNLVVADESHLLTGKRAQGFFSLLNSKNVRRALLLRAGTEPDADDDRALATVRFQHRDIVDWNGIPLYSNLPVALEVIAYQRSDQEKVLFESIEAFAEQLAESSEPTIARFADSISRSAASSAFAVDQRLREIMALLRPLRNAIVHGHIDQAAYQLWSQEQRSLDEMPVSAAAISMLYASGERLLTALADPPADSKLAALRDHLESQLASNHALCVWTGLAVTARYLGLALDPTPRRCYVLTAEQSLAESTEQLRSFERTGGVLITTGAAIQTYSLKFVAGCVHYDLPSNRSALEQRLGRFLRYGRAVPFRTWIMRDARRTLRWEDDLIDRVLEPNSTSRTQDSSQE